MLGMATGWMVGGIIGIIWCNLLGVDIIFALLWALVGVSFVIGPYEKEK